MRPDNILKKVNFYEDMLWSWQNAAAIGETNFWSYLAVTNCKFSSTNDKIDISNDLVIFFKEISKSEVNFRKLVRSSVRY